MALWGNRELVYDFSTVTVDLAAGTITGSGTTFTDAAVGISTGNVITVGAGATGGYAVIKTIDSDTQISVATTDFLIGNSSGVTYSISEEPLYTLGDSVYRAPEAKTVGYSTSPVTTAVYGVDATEVGVANTATGDARKYAPAHSGWVGITTYIQESTGELRVKTEVLVAGGIANDAEDTVYPDA
jgi:hypothetical protein